jgi:hypothetical protein
MAGPGTCFSRMFHLGVPMSKRLFACAAVGLALGCGFPTQRQPGQSSPNPSHGDAGTPGVGTAVFPTSPAERQAAIQQLRETITKDQPTSDTTFLERWKATHLPTLGYDPLKAQHLALIQGSDLRLNDNERAKLGQNGFVISGSRQFPTFFYGYTNIYAADLPLFISADSILYAVHRSYDAILEDVENAYLSRALKDLLEGMHRALASGVGNELGTSARADADLYLTVARRLLRFPHEDETSRVMPVAGASDSEANDLVARAMAAAGLAKLTLFGDPERVIDFSQFKPRGHYADSSLTPYFRAMIWLGRTDLRLIREQRFVRREFNLSALLAALMDAGRIEAWKKMDEILRGLVGESDNMTPVDFDRLRTLVNAKDLPELAAKSDEQLAEAITAGGFGIQRIASQIIFVPPQGLNAPLDRAFLFFGQRFILDSEVLSNVVFDRVLPELGPRRMMPKTFDVAFAALGNTHAAPFLKSDLGSFLNYPAALHGSRLLVDAHEPAFWSGSLYHAWLGTLRAMSPTADLAGNAPAGLPAVARTEPWSRRVLNTQLASWAELRHDTLLYAKQSYTGFPVCDFPDAYVDPYPDMWKALAAYADRGLGIVSVIPEQQRFQSARHFTELGQVARRLEDMARRQLNGTPFTAEQLAWVNEVVRIKEQSGGCVPTISVPEGWYVNLFYRSDDVSKHDPTIADVHTDPKNSEVLHVATGNARLMVMTADTCMGPRAYVGLVSSYYEKITKDFQRLDDMQWATELKTFPADVPWMQDLVVR